MIKLPQLPHSYAETGIAYCDIQIRHFIKGLVKKKPQTY